MRGRTPPVAGVASATVAALTAVLLLAAEAVLASDHEGDYVDLRRVQPITDGDAEAGRARAGSCLACHDASGMSPVPIYPNLRGQTVEYLYWSLVDFKRGRREGSVMTALVTGLEDQDLRDLAAFYAESHEQPLTAASAATAGGAANGGLLSRGEALYMHGDPEQGIPPCQGCHGDDARGHPLAREPGAPVFYRTYPALRGQQGAFLVSRLGEHRAGVLTDSTNDFIMNGAAAHLDDDSIAALAAWLASLPLD